MQIAVLGGGNGSFAAAADMAAAGHEVRLTRRVDSVRKAEGSYSEVVLPGCHEDIVGGYANQVRGRSNQLARLALGKLHSKAYAAGVPIWSMEKLKAKSTKLCRRSLSRYNQ